MIETAHSAYIWSHRLLARTAGFHPAKGGFNSPWDHHLKKENEMKSKLYDFSDEEFSQIVQESITYTEVCQKIGCSKSGDMFKRIKQRISNLELSTEHFNAKGKSPVKRTEANIFIENSTADQRTLRKWYIKGNYTLYVCSICGQKPIWNGKDLTLILDHINGHNHDDRLENLRWVCPNCNQQLPTTNGKHNI